MTKREMVEKINRLDDSYNCIKVALDTLEAERRAKRTKEKCERVISIIGSEAYNALAKEGLI